MKDRPRAFLTATGLTHEACARLLLAFAAAYAALSPSDKTFEGTGRPRQVGGGAQGVLLQPADTLLCILVSQKTHPLQTMPGVPCKLRQPQTAYWMPHVLPVVQHAFADLARAPERDASQVAPSRLMLEGAPKVALDGPERRRQRPQEATRHQEHDSGTKKAHTEKHLLLVHEHTGQGADLGPPIAGKMPDKKAADEAHMASPTNATLAKDTGLQGYEPEGVLTAQPKKSQKARHGVGGSSASITLLDSGVFVLPHVG